MSLNVIVAFMIDFIVSEAKGWKAHKNKLKQEQSIKGSEIDSSDIEYIEFDKLKSRQESVSTSNGDIYSMNH